MRALAADLGRNDAAAIQNRARLVEDLAGPQQEARQQASDRHARIAQDLASRRRPLCLTAWGWYRLAHQLRLAGEVNDMEAFVYRRFAYGLRDRDDELVRRLSLRGSVSTLDLFVLVPGSPGRIVLRQLVSEDQQTEWLGRVVLQNPTGPYKMDEVFRADPVDGMRPVPGADFSPDDHVTTASGG